MIAEPMAGDRLEDNLNPVGRLFYAASTMICVPTSLSQEVGAALGPQAGEAKLREVIGGAGFTQRPPRRRNAVQHDPRGETVGLLAASLMLFRTARVSPLHEAYARPEVRGPEDMTTPPAHHGPGDRSGNAAPCFTVRSAKELLIRMPAILVKSMTKRS